MTRFVETSDGCELYVRVAGDGAPIVLIHGLFGLVEHWRFQFPVLDRMARTIAYDLRGSGRSSKPPADLYSIEQQASDLGELSTGLGCDQPAVVVGHSMGSCVALEYALRRPEAVRALVLVDGFACGEHCLMAFDQMRESVSRKSTLIPLFKRVSFGESFRYHPDADELAQWCAEEACKLPTEAVFASARGFTAYDARARLGGIRVPTLVVVGDQDWSCPLDPSSQFLADHIPLSRLEVLHAGHFPMLEVAPSFNAVLVDFLREQVGISDGASHSLETA